ncbi:hypothetical protein [Mucilaginibacter sp.]
MKNADYKTFYLESITEINEKYYVLNGYPQQDYDENYYYEIHIESTRALSIIKTYIDEYICIDVTSENSLTIYYGEFYSESFDDGEFSYINYSYQKIKKTSKD